MSQIFQLLILFSLPVSAKELILHLMMQGEFVAHTECLTSDFSLIIGEILMHKWAKVL